MDSCAEYHGVERRKHCELVVIVNQKFSDFMEETKKYREDQQKSIADLSISMISVREEIKDLKRPYKILIWILTIVTGAFVIEGCRWAFEMLMGGRK